MKHIHYKLFIFIPLLLFPICFSLVEHAETIQECLQTNAPENPDALYFNTTFLHNYELVKQTLIETKGFVPVTLTTSDNLQLEALYKESSDAHATIILSAGFFPGRKEGLAPIITMLGSKYNILLFDARGHGTSQGSLLFSLTEYGLHEYKDILASIAWAHTKTNKPLILYGLCAGAFNTIKAMEYLIKNNQYNYYHIKGIIFDSGISSITKAAHIPLIHIQEKLLPSWFSQWYTNTTKDTIKKSILYKISCFLTSLILYPSYWYVLKRLSSHEEELTIAQTIVTIPCPILFLHGDEDRYSSFKSIEALIHTAQKPSTHIFQETDHALLHLKHSQQYKEVINSFICSLT